MEAEFSENRVEQLGRRGMPHFLPVAKVKGPRKLFWCILKQAMLCEHQ
jgi:hypothetical protein